MLSKETFSIPDRARAAVPAIRGGGRLVTSGLSFYGFEVDDAECRRLKREASESGLPHHHYPVALWSSEGPMIIYDNPSGGGSAYRQNVALTNRWKFQSAEQKSYARDIFGLARSVSRQQPSKLGEQKQHHHDRLSQT